MQEIGTALKDLDLGKELSQHIPKLYTKNLPGETVKKFFEKNSLNDFFASKLKFYMNTKGITGKDLALKLGVTEGAVNKWANGIRFPKDEFRLIKIADILGITIADLMPETIKQRELITREELKTNFDKYIDIIPQEKQKLLKENYQNSIVIKGDNHQNHTISNLESILSPQEKTLLEIFNSVDKDKQEQIIFEAIAIKRDKNQKDI